LAVVAVLDGAMVAGVSEEALNVELATLRADAL
jgi:hypothetical protein